jgi:PAS domain S-box-containing protein
MSDDTATQRDHSEAARRDLQQLSALLLEAEPAFVLDLQGKISEVNAAAQETYGLNRHQLLGRPFTTLVPPKWH